MIATRIGETLLVKSENENTTVVLTWRRAMGDYGAAAPNETKAGRAENRRVEVNTLVNKGIAGS